VTKIVSLNLKNLNQIRTNKQRKTKKKEKEEKKEKKPLSLRFVVSLAYVFSVIRRIQCLLFDIFLPRINMCLQASNVFF